MNECTLEQCEEGSKCDPSSPYVCLTNGGCSNDPNLWINSPACNDFCDTTNCTRSYKCNPATQICEKNQYLPDAYQHRFVTEKQCYDGSKSCIPQNPKPAPKPGPKPGPKPYPGQDNCYGRGTCVRFGAQGECTGCAIPCYKEGYYGFFCDECMGGYSCIDPNGDRVDSPDCLPPNKCELDNGPRPGHGI